MTQGKLRYMFDLETRLAARWVGKTPAGFRIDIEYQSAGANKVKTDPVKLLADWPASSVDWLFERIDYEKAHAAPAENGAYVAAAKQLLHVGPKAEELWAAGKPRAYLVAKSVSSREILTAVREYVAACPEYQSNDPSVELPWLGFDGDIVTGIDWAVLRADGVVEFDGRVTLRGHGPDSQNTDEYILINVEFGGAVDFLQAQRPVTIDQAAELLKTVRGIADLALAMRFEAPQQPEPWAAKRYKRNRGQLRYRHLSRGQFVGIGTINGVVPAGSIVSMGVYQILGVNK